MHRAREKMGQYSPTVRMTIHVPDWQTNFTDSTMRLFFFFGSFSVFCFSFYLAFYFIVVYKTELDFVSF